MNTLRARRPSRSPSAQGGFTLVELIVVLILLSVVVGMTSTLTLRPLEAYADVRRRTALTDLAEGATRRISRDIRAALPNSVRISVDGQKLELIHVLDGARYRADGGVNPSTVDHTAATDWLDFTGQETSFNVLGRFQQLNLAYGVGSPAGYRLAIYPTETTLYADAATAADPGVITQGAAGVFQLANDGDEDQVQLNAGFEMRFRLASPRQRLYVVDTPMTYICDVGVGTLVRHWGYAIAAVQPEDPSVNPLLSGSSARLANSISACAFSYSTATATHSGLVTIDLAVSSGTEQVRLLQQVHVSNAP
ncbi:MAG: prepilin-type N-terminal cleavage/methylation domain-containing protein [Myxococcota bacterium]